MLLRRTRSWAFVVALCLSVLTTASCSSDPVAESEPEAQEAVAGSGQASADGDVVGAEGVDLSVGEAVVSFPAGSATGAVVETSELPSSSAPEVIETAASADDETAQGVLPAGLPVIPLSGGVEVSLDGGATQPELPVTVTFSVVDPDPDGVAGVADGNVALVLLDEDGTTDVVPATYDPVAGTVSGQVSHFSSIWPVAADLEDLVETVLQTIGVVAPRPDCEGKTAQVEEETYSTVSGPQMWLCVVQDGAAGLRIEATPNSPTPFVATPSLDPSSSSLGVDVSAASAASVLATKLLGLVDEGQLPVFPGDATRLVYDEAPGPMTVQFDSAPLLYWLQIITETVSVVAGVRGGALVTMFDHMECAGEAIPATVEATTTPSAELAANVLRSVLACVATQLGPEDAKAGVVLSMLTAAPQLLVGGFLGIVTEASGLGSYTAPIDARVPAGTVSPQVAAPFLGTWHGPITEAGAPEYSVEMILKYTPSGELTGTVRYPELGNCRGYVNSARMKGSVLRMVEHITVGSRCVETVQLRLELVGDQLAYDASSGDAYGTLTRGPLPVVPNTGSSSWPTGRDEAPSGLTMWLGANNYEFPDWVACDDDTDWCLVGQTNDHVLVRMDGLVDVGSVPDDSPDPVGALTSLGAPAASVSAILRS